MKIMLAVVKLPCGMKTVLGSYGTESVSQRDIELRLGQ